MDYVCVASSANPDTRATQGSPLSHVTLCGRRPGAQRAWALDTPFLALTVDAPVLTRVFRAPDCDWVLVAQGTPAMSTQRGEELLDMLRQGHPPVSVCVATAGRHSLFAVSRTRAEWWASRDGMGENPLFYGPVDDGGLGGGDRFTQASSDSRGSPEWSGKARLLPGGSLVSVTPEDPEPVVTRWYTSPLHPPLLHATCPREAFLRLTVEAVQRHLLSGGRVPAPSVSREVVVASSGPMLDILSRGVLQLQRQPMHLGLTPLDEPEPEPAPGQQRLRSTTGEEGSGRAYGAVSVPFGPGALLEAMLDMVYYVSCARYDNALLCDMAPYWILMRECKRRGSSLLVMDHHTPRLLHRPSPPSPSRLKQEVPLLVAMARSHGLPVAFPLIDVHLNEHVAAQGSPVQLGPSDPFAPNPHDWSEGRLLRMVRGELERQGTTFAATVDRMRGFTRSRSKDTGISGSS
jgi:hypothetical protein